MGSVVLQHEKIPCNGLGVRDIPDQEQQSPVGALKYEGILALAEGKRNPPHSLQTQSTGLGSGGGRSGVAPWSHAALGLG